MSEECASAALRSFVLFGSPRFLVLGLLLLHDLSCHVLGPHPADDPRAHSVGIEG